MICPHCSADLLSKQRRGNRCSTCRKHFALDPKTNRLRLHDLRVRTLAAMLSDPQQPGAVSLRYTPDQLRLAASRRVLRDGPDRKNRWPGCAGEAGCYGSMIIIPAALAGSTFLEPALVALVVLLAICGAGHLVTLRRRRRPGLPISAAAFAKLLGRWESVYGSPPPGMLRPCPVTDAWPPTPPVALLYCTDAGTVAFLVAAGLVERCSVALIAPGPQQQPPPVLLAAVAAHPRLPVLVLHDADPAGCRSPERLRAVLPPWARVIDAGLRPRVAATTGPPVRTRPDAAALRELPASLDPAERDWLADGNTWPLAAVHPARLLRAVELTVGRVDPDTQRAAGVGFLDWPEAG